MIKCTMGPSQVCIYIQKEAKIEFYLGYTHTHICIYENLHIHLLCMCYIFYTVVYILKYSCIFILCIYLCIYNKLWNILKEMGIPEHLICLLRNLYAAEEATIRTRHGTTDWSKIGKGVRQDCILSPFLFNLYAEYIISDDGRDWQTRRGGFAGSGVTLTQLRQSLMADTHSACSGGTVAVARKPAAA